MRKELDDPYERAKALGWVLVQNQWCSDWYVGGACRNLIGKAWVGNPKKRENLRFRVSFYDPDRVVAILAVYDFLTENEALEAALEWHGAFVTPVGGQVERSGVP